MTQTPDRYPLPERVCGYGEWDEFERSRKESGQWVFWEDRVEQVLAGRYTEVKPLHVELSPTYLCNFACPWCSCRSAREVWADEDVFRHPQATPGTVMSCERLDIAVDRLAEHRIGIQWVGGEPTMHPGLLPAARRASEAGLNQCLFTNGSVLGARRVDAIFEAKMAFVRVSLDAVSEDVHRVHHGYREGRPYARIVLANLEELVARRQRSGATTQVGVSVVVDERNLGDLAATTGFIRSLCERYGRGAVDFVVVRPTYQFQASECELRPDTGGRLRELISEGAAMRADLEEAGVDVVAPKASFASTLDAPLDVDGWHHGCLSCGWFGEIKPTGEMVLCSDRYGDPDYVVGNLADSSLEDLWTDERRAAVLSMVKRVHCPAQRCPLNGRGFALNGVFNAIERERARGRISDVEQWVKDLRAVLPRPPHSFFL